MSRYIIIALSLAIIGLASQPANAQVGTFSGSAVQGLGTGASKKTEVEDVLTDASINDWLKEQNIGNLPAMLAKAKKGNINPRWQGPVWSPKNKRYNFRSAAERNATVEQLEKGVIALPPLWPFTLKERSNRFAY